jgi:hypothetical protein
MTKRDYAFGIIPVMKTESGYEFLIRALDIPQGA